MENRMYSPIVVVVSCLDASRARRVSSQVVARAGAQVGEAEGQEGQRTEEMREKWPSEQV